MLCVERWRSKRRLGSRLNSVLPNPKVSQSLQTVVCETSWPRSRNLLYRRNQRRQKEVGEIEYDRERRCPGPQNGKIRSCLSRREMRNRRSSIPPCNHLIYRQTALERALPVIRFRGQAARSTLILQAGPKCSAQRTRGPIRQRSHDGLTQAGTRNQYAAKKSGSRKVKFGPCTKVTMRRERGTEIKKQLKILIMRKILPFGGSMRVFAKA